ncbi:hypothetical protein MRAB57_157, partial [Mycobacterium rhizamassiliense]
LLTTEGVPRKAYEPREPRCRVCRDEAIRVLVNQLLDWRGAPILLGPGKVHAVTYTDILHDLEPLNARLDKKTKISYHSLRAHAERHHSAAGRAAYWESRIQKKLAELYGLTVEAYRALMARSD